MKKVTFETKAWISQYNNITPAEIGTEVGAATLYYSRADHASAGYTLVGNARITLEVPDTKTLVENKVTALKTEAKSIRAEASAKCTAIEGKIQQLLAIEHKPSVPAD